MRFEFRNILCMNNNMEQFLKIPNFQKSHSAFKEWMKSKYNTDVETLKDTDLKKTLFAMMKEVKNDVRDKKISYTSVDDLNNMALNKLQDFYVAKYNFVSQNQKLNVESLNREAAVYGNREMISNPFHPESSGVRSDDDISKSLNRILAERNLSDANTPHMNFPEPKKEVAIPISELESMMKSYQNNSFLEDNISLQKPLVPDNPKQFFEVSSTIQEQNDNTVSYDISQPHPVQFEEDEYEKPVDMIPRLKDTQTVRRYVIINGFDRDWIEQPLRYKWRMNFNDLQYTYKNIRKIKCSKLILPMENNDTKNKAFISHNRDYKLSYQYVALHVDEFTDLYDGFNDTVKNTFTCFVYDSYYVSPNGRGFIIMKPVQNEKKEYYQHLNSITSFSASFCKPSGSLISDIKDNYEIKKVEFEYYNQMYLKIVLNKYFDKSEYNIGDSVKIKNYIIYKTNCSSTNVTESYFVKVNEFINRSIGHEIVEMGQANEQGFFNTFYIPGPTLFNESTGVLSLDNPMIEAIREFNISGNICGGNIINVSLQPVLYIQLGIESGIVKHSDFD